MSTRQTGRAALVMMLVAMLAVPMLAGAVVAQESTETSTPTPTPTPTASSTPANASASSGVTLSDRARITAVSFDKDYLRTTREESNTWKTVGPYAVFASSERIEAARITQPNANARVLDGGHTVRVSYDEEAAPPNLESLYTVELFFEDGSQLTLRLLATQTDQIVASSEMQEASDFIETMREDAEAHGYKPTIEGIEEYHEWEKEQADLFDNLFAPQFEKLFAWLILTIQTPFALITMALLVILVARHLLKTHGAILRERQNGVDLVEQSRQQMYLSYLGELDAADEERLEDVDEIGPAHVYWDDALGISSVKQLADEFAWGRPLTDDHGNLVRYTEEDDVEPMTTPTGDVVEDANGDPVYPPKLAHRGIEDLRDVDNLRDTWLEPLLRPDMLGDPQSALAHAKRALMRMTTHYGHPEYQPARRRVKSMLQSMSEGDAPNYRLPADNTPQRTGGGSGPRPAGGDD